MSDASPGEILVRLSLGNRLREFFGRNKGVIPTEPVSYRAIGVVRNRIQEPLPFGWQGIQSDIILRDDLARALDFLDGFSHAIVVFHLNRVSGEESRYQTVRIGREGVEVGILASRSALRPNPIGVSVVPIVRRRQNVLRVRGLDALNETPVLDIKPYLPPYDSVPDAKLPAWARVDDDG